MRKLRIISALLLVAAVLMVPVAAASNFVPSIEEKDSIHLAIQGDGNKAVLGTVTLADGTTVELTTGDVSMISYAKANGALDQVAAQLGVTSFETLIPGFTAAWEKLTGGAPVENAVIAQLFDITAKNGIAAGATATFEIVATDVAPGTHVVILHNYEGDKWELIPGEWTEDGHIRFTVTSLSPFALVVDSAKAPVVGGNAPTSPSTAESASNYSMMLCLAAVALCGICAVKVARRTAK